MPDEVLPVVSGANYQNKTVLDELQMSAVSGMPHLPAVTTLSGAAIGFVVLIASSAFALGIWVARKTMAPLGRSGLSSEGRRLTEGECYGSI